MRSAHSTLVAASGAFLATVVYGHGVMTWPPPRAGMAGPFDPADPSKMATELVAGGIPLDDVTQFLSTYIKSTIVGWCWLGQWRDYMFSKMGEKFVKSMYSIDAQQRPACF